MKKPLFFLSLLFMTILVLSVVQVVATNRLSTTGTTLGALQDEIKKYKTENAILKETVLEASSLTQIASSAATLGLEPSKSHVFVGQPQPIALQR